MNKLLATTLTAAAAISQASPVTSPIVQNDSYSALGTSVHSFNFNQFNTALGTLTAVKFEIISAVIGGKFTMTTGPQGNAGITLNSYTTDIYVYAPGASIDGTTNSTVVSFTNGSLPLSQLKDTTVDYIVAGSQDIATSGGTSFDVLSSDFLYFTGNSTFNIDVNLDAAAGVTAAAGRDPIKNFSNYYANTSVRLTYTFTPVPEASTYGIALGGLALAAVAVRRRKQAK